MSRDELKQEAIALLSKAFKGDNSIPSHIVQAATAVLLTPEPK